MQSHLSLRARVGGFKRLHHRKSPTYMHGSWTCNNVLIVCKKYYIEVILKELDTCNGTSPQTYTPCTAHVGDLLAAHVDFMNGQNINVPTDLRNLPSFYWLPKMHKNPIGSRFIAASSACTTKPLSKLLTYMYSLKLVAKHFKQYCEGITRNTGINCFG